jgi:hypothetical protein
MPEFYARHLGALFFQPYADDLAEEGAFILSWERNKPAQQAGSSTLDDQIN